MEEKIRVLVADDNRLQLQMACDALSEAGFEAIAAGHGPNVYREVVKNKPHLILLDIVMPDIDGIEMCKTLKRAPVTKDVLIAIYSSRREPAFMDLTYEAGADAYIIKSGDFEEIVGRVRDIIQDKLGKQV